jgi:hypothetical protein
MSISWTTTYTVPISNGKLLKLPNLTPFVYDELYKCERHKSDSEYVCERQEKRRKREKDNNVPKIEGWAHGHILLRIYQ